MKRLSLYLLAVLYVEIGAGMGYAAGTCLATETNIPLLYPLCILLGTAYSFYLWTRLDR